jgi:hypothetical protein
MPDLWNILYCTKMYLGTTLTNRYFTWQNYKTNNSLKLVNTVQIAVLRVVTPCYLVGGWQGFGVTCYLQLQGRSV